MKNKKASHDFRIESLPKTRRQQFSDLVKHRYGDLMKLGLLTLLFALPLLASCLIRDMAILAIPKGEGMEEQAYSMLFSTTLIHGLIRVVALGVLSLGLAGSFLVIRELCYSEPVFFREDFLSGIKKNWKQALIISLIVSVLLLVQEMLQLMLNNLIAETLPMAINLVVLFPVCLVAFYVCSTYSNSFLGHIKVSFGIYSAALPKVALSYLLVGVLMLPSLLPVGLIFVEYPLIIALIIFLSPMSLLAIDLLFLSVFDEHINKVQFPEYYKKGLYFKDQGKAE